MMIKKIKINQTTIHILALYRGDYRRVLHYREIARELDVPDPSGQLKKLEHLRIIRTVKRGQNVDHFLNLDNMITRYYLVLAEIFASINLLEEYFLIKKVADELRDQIDGILVLFGSYAKEQARETSDVDLFSIGDKAIDTDVVQSVEDSILREVNIKHTTPAEFLSGLNAKAPLEHEVLSNHIILKGADEFCDIVWKYYAEA